MSALTAVGIGVFVGAVHGIGERSWLFGVKVTAVATLAALAFGNMF